MKYFLIMLIMVLVGGGFYEYAQLQQQSAAHAQELNDLVIKAETVQAGDEKLKDDASHLSKKLHDVRDQLSGLGKLIASHANDVVAVKRTDSPRNPFANRSVKKPKPPPASNELGTITTTDGTTYEECHLIKVEEQSIVVTYTGGIMEITYKVMPPELQKRFGYDPKTGKNLTDDQIEYYEQQRLDAIDAAGADY